MPFRDPPVRSRQGEQLCTDAFAELPTSNWRTSARGSLILFSLVAWTAITAAADVYFGRDVVRQFQARRHRSVAGQIVQCEFRRRAADESPRLQIEYRCRVGGREYACHRFRYHESALLEQRRTEPLDEARITRSPVAIYYSPDAPADAVLDATFGAYDLVTALALATFSAPALLVWGALAAAFWQEYRTRRAFEPHFDRRSRPDRKTLPAGSIGLAAMSAWMAGLGAVVALATAIELGAELPPWAILTAYFAVLAVVSSRTLVSQRLESGSASETWDRLARKTRWAPFFTRPAVACQRNQLAIRERWGLRLAIAPAFLALGMFGSLALWQGTFGALSAAPWPVHIVLQLILIGCILISVYCLTEQRSMTCSHCPDRVTISYGWLLAPRCVDFEPRSLAVSINFDERLRSAAHAKQRPVLLLSREGQPSPTLWLASGEFHHNLRELFEPLARQLGGECSDQTVFEAALPDGRNVPLGRLPSSAGSLHRRVSFATPDVARTTPTWGMRLVYLAFLSFAAFGAVGLVATLHDGWDWRHALAACFWLCFVVPFGAFGLGGFCCETSTLIDRRRGTIEIRAAAPWPQPPQSIPLHDVVAIQLCTRPGDDAPTYQLNWVLAAPPGKRVPILDGHNQELVASWAAQLGEFLNKPVLDHAWRAEACSANRRAFST